MTTFFSMTLKTTMWTGCFIHFSFIKVLYFAEAETLEFWKQQLKNKSLFIFRRKLVFSQTLSSFGVSIFKKATIPILPELNDIFFWTNTKMCSPKRLSFALMKIDFLFLTLCFFLDGKVNEKEKWSTELNRWKGVERTFSHFFS